MNDDYILSVKSPVTGGYLSSEQIDLLTIIQCQSIAELNRFIQSCDQIRLVDEDEKYIGNMDLESAKRKIFKCYQDTLVPHDSGVSIARVNACKHIGVDSPDDLVRVFNKTHTRSREILDLFHHFISLERDQNKDPNLYEELSLLNSQLGMFGSITVSSGCIYNVVNRFDNDKETRFDFYHAQRDLDFAYKNDKHVRYHSLLVQEDPRMFDGKSKEQILAFITEYVKKSIDFINDYNSTHKITINGVEEPLINAVDIFNEIISFDKDETGKYFNIWEKRYGITTEELMHCFDYAKEHKPDGVAFLYNEPFLEDTERRKKVLETLEQIEKYQPALIDTLGTQMHISLHQGSQGIRECFADFKRLQDEKGINIQITEFDMSLGKSDIPRVFGPAPDVTLEQVYQIKRDCIEEISAIIDESQVKLSGVSYWSLTDGIDCNLERIRSTYLKENPNMDIYSIPTACGGLIPTHKKYIKKNNLNAEELNEEQNLNFAEEKAYTRFRKLDDDNFGKVSKNLIIIAIIIIIILLGVITYLILK